MSRERLERAAEGVDVTQPISPEKFKEITEAQEKFAVEFGEFFKIGPVELERRIARAEAEGLFEKFEKEQREAAEARAELAEFGAEFLRPVGETETEFFRRTFPLAEEREIDPTLAKALGIPEETAAARKEREKFFRGALVGARGPPELTFAGKVFKATVESEARLGREIGPAAAALGGIGARIIGTAEEFTGFLGKITGTAPGGRRARVPPPTFISPFLGISPLEREVHPARRFISGLAAGAVIIPLESKAFSAGIKAATRGIGSATRSIGEGIIFRKAGRDVIRVTKRRIIRVPFGERGARVGEIGVRAKPLRAEKLVGVERGPGIAAERFLDRLEAAQIARPRLTAPLRPFFGKPKVIELAEARRLTIRTLGRVSRGGPKVAERVRIEFAKTGVKVSERQFRKIQEFLRSLDPETAAITGVKRARGVLGGVDIQFKGLGQRPAQNVLRLLGGEKGVIKTIELGDVAVKKTTSRLLRQTQFGFREPSIRGKLTRVFRPEDQRRIARTILGERGAEIGRLRPKLPFRLEKFRLTKLESVIKEGVPEIVEEVRFRRLVETFGIQRAAPGDVSGVTVIERLRISAQPSIKTEKLLKIIRGKPRGPMKPLDFGVPKGVGAPPAGVAAPSDTGLGGLRALLETPGRVAERGRLTFRVLAGVPVKVKPAVSARLSSLLRLGSKAAATTIAQQRIRPIEKPVSGIVSGESAKVVDRIKVGEIPIVVTRPIQRPAAAQQQRVRQQQAAKQALRQIVRTSVATTSGVESVGVPRAAFLPPIVEDGKAFDVELMPRRRVVKRERRAPVVDITRLFDVPTFKPIQVGRKRKGQMKVEIPEIKLPFSEG
jgi:hypothetical protein